MYTGNTKVIKRKNTGLLKEELGECADVLITSGGTVVLPTKVGYIIITTDGDGMKRKFELKGRPETKPSVVLLSNLEQLLELAEVPGKVFELYEECWSKDILLGCILHWKKDAIDKYVPSDGSRDLMMDKRETSCFVIKYGTPSEVIAEWIWHYRKKLVFASSANPSGKGNRGVLEGVGNKILDGVDLIIEDDAYVKSQQPDADEETRWEQGTMVSMVDVDNLNEAVLVDKPIIIRDGLALDKIKAELAVVYGEDGFGHRHKAHY